MAAHARVSSTPIAVTPKLPENWFRNGSGSCPLAEGGGVRGHNALSPTGTEVGDHEGRENGERLELGPDSVRDLDDQALRPRWRKDVFQAHRPTSTVRQGGTSRKVGPNSATSRSVGPTG